MPVNSAGTDKDEFLPVEDTLLPSEIMRLVDESTPGPEASSDAPPTEGTTSDETHGGDDDLDLPEFDKRYREDFDGLLYLGALTDEFVWGGHRFKIRTITTGELLEVGLAQRVYRDTLGESRAYVTAVVAASIVLVDGRALPRPISNDIADTEFANKFAYVKDSWFPWVIDAVYQEYMKLEARATEIIEAMGKASPSVRSTSG